MEGSEGYPRGGEIRNSRVNWRGPCELKWTSEGKPCVGIWGGGGGGT